MTETYSGLVLHSCALHTMVQTTLVVRRSNEEVTIKEPEHASDYGGFRFGVDFGIILCSILLQ